MWIWVPQANAEQALKIPGAMTQEQAKAAYETQQTSAAAPAPATQPAQTATTPQPQLMPQQGGKTQTLRKRARLAWRRQFPNETDHISNSLKERVGITGAEMWYVPNLDSWVPRDQAKLLGLKIPGQNATNTAEIQRHRLQKNQTDMKANERENKANAAAALPEYEQYVDAITEALNNDADRLELENGIQYVWDPEGSKWDKAENTTLDPEFVKAEERMLQREQEQQTFNEQRKASKAERQTQRQTNNATRAASKQARRDAGKTKLAEQAAQGENYAAQAATRVGNQAAAARADQSQRDEAAAAAAAPEKLKRDKAAAAWNRAHQGNEQVVTRYDSPATNNVEIYDPDAYEENLKGAGEYNPATDNFERADGTHTLPSRDQYVKIMQQKIAAAKTPEEKATLEAKLAEVLSRGKKPSDERLKNIKPSQAVIDGAKTKYA